MALLVFLLLQWSLQELLLRALQLLPQDLPYLLLLLQVLLLLRLVLRQLLQLRLRLRGVSRLHSGAS